MADKEIGLVQVRVGKQRNLPSALELGEIAFTTDECRVFVGLPSTIIPASLVAGRTKITTPGSAEENVEILTEFTPAHVLSRALNKAVRFDIQASVWKSGQTEYVDDATTIQTLGHFLMSIPSADRLFVDYTAYSIDGSTRILETGSIQVIVLGADVLLSQQNNSSSVTNDVWITASSPYVDGAL